MLKGYRCECLSESYSSRHCEIEREKTKMLRRFALSMAYVAILVIISTALLIVSMDILNYVFNIDKVKEEKKAKNKRRKIMVVHYVYANASNSCDKRF